MSSSSPRTRRSAPARRAVTGLIAGGAVLAAAAPAFATSGSDAPDAPSAPDLSGVELTISNWDAYTPENLIPSFEEATGATVNLTLHATNEEIVAKLLQSGGEG